MLSEAGVGGQVEALAHGGESRVIDSCLGEVMRDFLESSLGHARLPPTVISGPTDPRLQNVKRRKGASRSKTNWAGRPTMRLCAKGEEGYAGRR